MSERIIRYLRSQPDLKDKLRKILHVTLSAGLPFRTFSRNHR
jgi:hypothetical protein